MGNIHFDFQIKDAWSGAGIFTAGGKCHVSTGGSPDKLAIYDANGAALANPLTPVRGFIDFYCADTVSSVDLYCMAPGGQFVTALSIGPASGPNEIEVNISKREQTAKIPFSYVDRLADATEMDTGFDLPNPSLVLDRLHGSGIYVTALDATETIDVGTGEGVPVEVGGDSNGFNAAAVLDNLGLLVGTNGALFSSNAPYRSDANAAKSITYKLSAGSDTAKGFIILRYILI